jgi:hypothetical protein
LMTVWTSKAVSCALATTGQRSKPAMRDNGTRDLTGVRFILELRGVGYENPRARRRSSVLPCSYSAAQAKPS